MPSASELYIKLVDAIFAAGIHIRTEPCDTTKDVAFKARYLPNGYRLPEVPGPSVIALPRSTGKWYTPTSSTSDKALLVEGVDIDEEICYLAHEFGHHGSKFREYEEILSRVKKCLSEVSDEERRNFYQEEESAWNKGREILASLGYTSWETFEAIRAAALETYHLGLWPSAAVSGGSIPCSRDSA